MRKVIIMFALAMGIATANAQENVTAVSYTHLDVYKRQVSVHVQRFRLQHLCRALYDG